MSARNMVRNMRESGALDAKPAGSAARSNIAIFFVALGFGALAYFAAVLVTPLLVRAVERDPPPMPNFVRQTAEGAWGVTPASEAPAIPRLP